MKKSVIWVFVLLFVVLVTIAFLYLKNNKNEYMIIFDTQGGTIIEKQIVKEKEKAIKPTNPTKEGYTFVEWQLNGKTYDFNKEVTSDLTLVAKYEQNGSSDKVTYKVTFNSDGGSSIATEEVEEGKTATKPANPTKEGYTFVEWQLNGKTYDFNKEVTSDITLVANWTKSNEESKKYTVTFDSKGGSSVKSQTVEENKKATKPSNPTKNGYTFNGWTLNGKAYDFNTKVTKNITLVATWTENNGGSSTPTTKKYTVTFDSKGGSSVKSQTVEENSKATKPSNPTRSGYTFTGWTLNGKAYDFNTKITSNITLVATWTENAPVVKKYTVTFDSKGGSSINAQTVEENSKATKPSDPTRSGYTFNGWTLNGKVYDFNTKVTSNITLVATWTENAPVVKKYTVTFDSKGGSSINAQTVEENSKATKPSDPTRSGYTFTGWTLNGQSYDFNTKVTSNITLVATWTENTPVAKTYTVTVTPVDNYSPDRILTVKENGTKISFKQINYIDGVMLCSGSNPTVSFSDLTGETQLIVVLNDNSQVTATIN